MALRHVQTKPESRFVVVDDEINSWAVYDKQLKTVVISNFHDPLAARQVADKYNENPPGD